MKYPLPLLMALFALTSGISQPFPSIWRLPYTTALLQFNTVFEFCADGRVTVIQTGPGTLPSCKVCDWWRFGDEIFIRSILSEMTATINDDNLAQPFLQNIQLSQSNDILFFYPTNTQPDAFIYPVTLAQLGAYKQIGGCPVVPQCALTNWSTVSVVELSPHESDLVLSPNPVIDLLHIQVSEGAEPPLAVRLVDSNGRTVHYSDSPKIPLTLDLSYLPSGLYVLQSTFQQGISTLKVLKT